MKQVTTVFFRCERCRLFFKEASEAEEHEKGCLPLEENQYVKFIFGLLQFEGRITRVSPAQSAEGNVATVDIETEVEVAEPDWSQLHDGKHVWVHWSDVIEILSNEPSVVGSN